MYLAKLLVKLNIKECLSLDLLNFVSIDDFPFYMRWENAGVTNLNHIMDTVTNKRPLATGPPTPRLYGKIKF